MLCKVLFHQMVLVLEMKPNNITGFVLGINLIVVLFPELK